MQKNREYFEKKGYTKEEIDNHYEHKRFINAENKKIRDNLKIKYKKEFEKAKKYFKKVVFSTRGDGLWFTSEFGRTFSEFGDLDFYIDSQNRVFNK